MQQVITLCEWWESMELLLNRPQQMEYAWPWSENFSRWTQESSLDTRGIVWLWLSLADRLLTTLSLHGNFLVIVQCKPHECWHGLVVILYYHVYDKSIWRPLSGSGPFWGRGRVCCWSSVIYYLIYCIWVDNLNFRWQVLSNWIAE